MRPAPWTPAEPVTEEAIRWAYRLVFDREPDPGGLAYYAGRAASDGLTLARLREIFLASEEYRARIRQRTVAVDIGGASVIVDTEDHAFGATIAEHGMWEPHLQAVIGRHLRAGDVFVDVGANVGVLSFRAARLVGAAGKVIAFEPDPSNASLFLRGVVANGFGQVTLFPFALSDRRSVFALQGGSNAYLVEAGVTDIVAQSLPGDDILDAESRIDCVKLDIEGHEPQALRGLARTLARHRPMVLCEFNPRCLTTHIGADPAVFAAQIFGLTRQVTAIEHDAAESIVGNAADLLALWADRDRRASESGTLPPGMLHLDLLFRPG